MSRYLIIGKSFSGLESKILDRGDEFIILKDGAPKSAKNSSSTRYCDFKSHKSIDEAVKKLPRIDGVIAIYENYIVIAAKISKMLDRPGLPPASALACTDKLEMRRRFAESNKKLSPDFKQVKRLHDVEDFAAKHSFPLIMKPANLSKSLLVTKNNSTSELRRNYKKSVSLLGKTYAKYASASTPTLIIEEFLVGTIHSVDAFVDSKGEPKLLEHIVDYQTGYDIGYDDNFHYSRKIPSILSKEKQKQLLECAKEGIKALGMKNSPAHVEIIMTKDGPKIVEIGARNGGYRSRMHHLANGIDIAGAALDLAVGKTTQIQSTKDEPCAVLELFPKKVGNFQGLKNEKKLRALKSLVYLSIKAKPDHIIGKSSDGHKMCAVIILHNSDKKQFDKDLAFVDTEVSVITK